VVLGRGRVDLLEAIERHHSIRGAAASLGMSYRRAWLLVQSINSACDRRLVEATKGGNSRGGAIVTPFGKETIRRFYLLDRALQATATRVLRRF
jgi:molybdate transport system regulatory protein